MSCNTVSFALKPNLKSTTAVAGMRVDSKTCLIMDEVDGMSAGDRGGVGALNALIKKTKVRHTRPRTGKAER